MSTEKKTQHKDIRDAKAFKAVGQGVEKVGKIKFISEFKDFISKGNVMDCRCGIHSNSYLACKQHSYACTRYDYRSDRLLRS